MVEVAEGDAKQVTRLGGGYFNYAEGANRYTGRTYWLKETNLKNSLILRVDIFISAPLQYFLLNSNLKFDLKTEEDEIIQTPGGKVKKKNISGIGV